MGGIFDMSDLFFQTHDIASSIKEWFLLLMTTVWSIAALVGIIHWNRVNKGVTRFSTVIMLCVIIKFFLVWIGCFKQGTIRQLYLIFWIQAILNVINCLVMHSSVQQFHKRTSVVGKVAKLIFLMMLFGLWYNISALMGTVRDDNSQKKILSCNPQLYPKEWFVIFSMDFLAGFLSCILYCFYTKDMDLSNGEEASRKEIKHLVNYIQETFNCPSIYGADQESQPVISFCSNVRDMIFAQMRQQAFYTMFFGVFQLCMAWFGAYYIQNLTPDIADNPALRCIGPFQQNWSPQNSVGNMFLSCHTFVLVMSAGTIVRTFYFMPRSRGLMANVQFKSNDGRISSFCESNDRNCTSGPHKQENTEKLINLSLQ